MKTSRRWVQPLSLAAGGLLICLPSVFAAPGGGGTVGLAGPASGGGGAHAATTASVGVARSAGPSGAARSSVGTASGFRPAGVGNVGATGYRPSSPGTMPNRVVSTPAANFGRTGSFYGQTPGVPRVGINGHVPSVARVNNAWTDPATGATRSGGYAAAPHRSDPFYTTRPGNHLYAGAYGDGSNRFSDGRTPRGPNNGYGYRNHHHYYYNNFPYGVYYPYLYNNYGYAGYGNYGYGDGLVGSTGLSTDNSVADLGAPDFSNTPNNYYSYVAPEQETPNANPAAAATQPLPDAPAVGPQGPSSADNKPVGPDSLVEAVQTELARRGYFEGKLDSMYSPATKEAIRRFQTDQGLPATGRINEATLHALRLD